jgi:membrane fusion protein, multidrug efflux system
VTAGYSRLLLLSAVLLVCGSQWRCGSSTGDPGPKPFAAGAEGVLAVKASPVDTLEWVATVPISGDLHSVSNIDVKPEVGGRLIAVHFEEGDIVKKDQLLAEIDTTNYQLAHDQAMAALSVAQAGIERAQVAAEHARTEKERADNLLRSGGITEKDHQAAMTGVKEADSQVRLAEAQHGQARAALAIAAKALKDCRIFAPAAGQVQQKFYDQGSLLSPGMPLCTLVDNSRLELECVIPSYQLASVRIGQTAEFTTPTWGERRFSGTVAAVNPTVESDNRSVKLKLKIANPGGELRNGMYARGEITTSREKNALVISRDALIPDNEGSDAAAVYVIRDGKAHRLDIRVGGARQDRVWVKEGLARGESVITEIGPSLKEGALVQAR